MGMKSDFGRGGMMNHFIKSCGLLATLGVVCLGATRLAAQEWSPAQQEVIEFLDGYGKIRVEGTLEEDVAYFHPDFLNWNYADALPLTRELTRQELIYLKSKYKQTLMEMRPIAIQLHGDVAVVQVYYRERFRDATGKDTTVAGPWTITMVKQDNKWLFFSWTWSLAGFRDL